MQIIVAQQINSIQIHHKIRVPSIMALSLRMTLSLFLFNLVVYSLDYLKPLGLSVFVLALFGLVFEELLGDVFVFDLVEFVGGLFGGVGGGDGYVVGVAVG